MSKRKVKVAIVTNFVPHYRAGLFRELSRRHDVRLLTTTQGREWYWQGPHRGQPDGFETTSLRSPASLLAELRSGGYEAAVLGLTGRAALLAGVTGAKSIGLPWILWVGIWEHPRTAAHVLSRPLARALYQSADAIVTYGPHVSEYVAGESGRTSRVFVARQAVENERFRDSIDGDTILGFRSRLGLGARPTALFIGRVTEEKGLDVLLEASARVDLEHDLVVAGEGPLVTGMKEKAQALGIADRVVFVGHRTQDELPLLLAASDLLVLPSVSTRRFREPWGLVVNEAMNAGLPVIATDAVGAAAGGLVVHDDTGLVVPQRDPDALARALAELVGDPDRRRRLGESGRRQVLDWNYSVAADGFDAALASIPRPLSIR
jgi:glycosyltransferase involved in cell wall biosynthesis